MDDGENKRETEDEEVHSAAEEGQEEWGGIEASGDREGAETHYGKKLKKPPTGEELRDMKDASELYRSSSFRLQVRLASSTLL